MGEPVKFGTKIEAKVHVELPPALGLKLKVAPTIPAGGELYVINTDYFEQQPVNQNN
ncbi:MAG: hypothetical protein R3F37_02150 [Candidatus Competibacteraceae bacterium]